MLEKAIKFKDKSIFKKIHIFKNVKYKWGGKSFKGIDCSGLVQIMLNFNNLSIFMLGKDKRFSFLIIVIMIFMPRIYEIAVAIAAP